MLTVWVWRLLCGEEPEFIYFYTFTILTLYTWNFVFVLVRQLYKSVYNVKYVKY